LFRHGIRAESNENAVGLQGRPLGSPLAPLGRGENPPRAAPATDFAPRHLCGLSYLLSSPVSFGSFGGRAAEPNKKMHPNESRINPNEKRIRTNAESVRMKNETATAFDTLGVSP
jgi:hypothetical protein